jgi:fibrillarin-like pre-rRNA processing protein
MKPTRIVGVFRKNDKLYTENPDSCKGFKVYNERLTHYKNKEFRSWNPYRSKLAAAILKKFIFNIKPDSNVLYLGAATGTTVSHISDMVKDGMVYAVESSPIAANDLIQLSRRRKNVIPILEDAYHSERYCHLVCPVDVVYQDISQRNQAEIFLENIERYLKKDGLGILMVKARSIDVSLKPKETYELVADKLREQKLNIINLIDLSPYEKDHAAIVVSLSF